MADIKSIFDDAEPPFYVRSLERRTHWRDDPLEILNKVFPVDDDGTISVWKICSYTDLKRVAVAINANRVAGNPQGASHSEPLHFIAIKTDDIGTIELRKSPGLTDCVYAKSLHYGVVIVQESQREDLVNSLLSAGRKPGRMTKGKMKDAFRVAEEDGCHAVVKDASACACESEADSDTDRLVDKST